MGLINRDKSTAEQCDNWDIQTITAVGVSSIIPLIQAPYQSVLVRVASLAYGLSGSPIMGLQIQRFVTGAGLTTIPINGSSLLTVVAMGTSGQQIHSIPAVSSSLVQLLAGDSVQAVTSGANTAGIYVINAVCQCLQDFKTHYGLYSGS